MEAAEHHHRGAHPGILCGQVRESEDDHHKEINQKHNGKLLKVIMEAAASASQEISEHLIFTLPVLCWKHAGACQTKCHCPGFCTKELQNVPASRPNHLTVVFSHRCEVGTENWAQCNDHPIKICKYPVSGLFEGHSYYFRVRAVNSHGISKASRMSDPIAALDPTEFEKLHSGLDWNTVNLISCLDIMQILHIFMNTSGLSCNTASLTTNIVCFTVSHFHFLCSQKTGREAGSCVLPWWSGRWQLNWACFYMDRVHSSVQTVPPSIMSNLSVKRVYFCVCVCVFSCVDEGKPPAAPTAIYASETDRTYVVLSWKAPAYSSRAPMWYYIEKVMPHRPECTTRWACTRLSA